MNDIRSKTVRISPLANHYTVLLLVLVLAFVGCNDKPRLNARFSQPQLGNKFVTYQFDLPNVDKIKARNPDENFTLTRMNFTATSTYKGCDTEEETIDYSKDMKSFSVDLRPGCAYTIKIDGMGLQLNGTPTKPDPTSDTTPGTKPGSKPATGLKVTYQQDIAPLMQKHCISCHIEQGPMQAYPLSNVNQIKARLDNIIERVELENMPPRGPFFSDNQIQKLKDWRSQGFLLTQPLQVSDQTTRLLCTSKEFKFTAGNEADAKRSVVAEFTWYFERDFNK